jgi:hypothetical protein
MDVYCLGGPFDGRKVSVVDDESLDGRTVGLGETIFIPDADYSGSISIHTDDEEFVPYRLHIYLLTSRISHPSKPEDYVYYNAVYIDPKLIAYPEVII